MILKSRFSPFAFFILRNILVRVPNGLFYVERDDKGFIAYGNRNRRSLSKLKQYYDAEHLQRWKVSKLIKLL